MTLPTKLRPEREIPPTRHHRCPACYDTGLVAGKGKGLEKFLPCSCETGDTVQAACAGLRLDAEVASGQGVGQVPFESLDDAV